MAIVDMSSVPLALRLCEGLAVGSILGSFFGTLVVRWYDGRSVLTGRSACDVCTHQLRWHELVPVASFLAHRGRCAACESPIAAIHPLFELVGLGLGLLIAWTLPDLRGFMILLGAMLSLALAVLDLRLFWLPDPLTLPLLGFGLAEGAMVNDVEARLIGIVLGYGLLRSIALIYRLARHRDGMGRADAKLLAAIGAWTGWEALPYVVIFAAATGLLIAALARLGGVPVSADTKAPFGTYLLASFCCYWLMKLF